MSSKKKIPIRRPLLPKADKIMKYLTDIDENRWYSNFGPLVQKFEHRLADLFNVNHSALITMANATAALTAVLGALKLEENSLCLVPSWTFVATAAAPFAAKMRSYFVDVEDESWALCPESIKQQLRYIPGKVGAVIVVAPFGAPIKVQAWDKFTEETGIPVIIDAAAAFDAVQQLDDARYGKTPIVVSMHATKSFGIGEGAFVISQDKQLLHSIRQYSNYGFTATREIFIPGVNSKLSEYCAAVGLAALDEWSDKRQAWVNVTNCYINEFQKKSNQVTLTHRLSSDWISSVCNVIVPDGYANDIIEQLSQAGIESRKWWKSCHIMKAYESSPRFALPVTDKLYDSVVAIPFSEDLPAEDIAYVVDELTALF